VTELFESDSNLNSAKAICSSANAIQLNADRDRLLLLETLIDLAPDAIFITNPDGKLTEVNAQACELLGYGREELLGNAIAHVIASIEDLEQLITANGRATQNTSPAWSLIHKDGSQLPVTIRARMLPGGGWVAYVRDLRDRLHLESEALLQERQQAAIALQEKENQIQQLSDSMPQFVWMCNSQGELDYVNRQWIDYSGLSLEQTRDRQQMIHVYHPDDVNTSFERWALALQNKQPLEFEARFKRGSDGAYRWFLVRATPVLDDQGNLCRWYGTSTDIHDQKLATLNEQFLSELDTRLRQLTDAEAMGWEVVRSVGEYLKVDRCLWNEIDAPAQLAIVKQDWFRQGDVPSVVGVHRLADFGTPELIRLHETGQTVIVDDVTTHPYTASLVENYIPFGTFAYVTVPCVRQGEWVTLLVVNSKTPRNWRRDEVALLQNVAARLWSLIEQTRALKALQDSELHFRTLADNIAQLAWIADNEGWIFWYNRRWFDYTGTTLAEMEGWGWRSVHHPDHIDRVVERFRRSIATGEAWEDTFPMRGQDGQYRWFLSRAFPIRDEQGQVLRWFGTNTDITDRKQAELDLQHRTQHVQLLYETTRDLLSTDRPLTLIDTIFAKLQSLIEIDVYFNYLLKNEQLLHLSFYGGITDEVARSIEWLDVGKAVCGKVAQGRCQIVQLHLQQSTDPNTELVRSLGLTAYSCQPLIAQGKLFGTLGFGSRRRETFTEAETGLLQAICDQIAIALERAELVASLQRQTEELRQTNRLKDDFFSALSHELRTPLNPILGWTKLLQGQKLTPEKVTQALTTIERSVRQQISLVDDLLDVSRVIQGKLRLDLHPVELVSTIITAMETVEFAAQAKSITLEFIYPSEIYTRGDGDRLGQVFWNLLSNAIKFTPENGQVTITLERVGNGEDESLVTGHRSLEAKGRMINDKGHSALPLAQIQIKDNGIGIDPDFMPHIFEYFRQAEGGASRQYSGLGLGLAIVRHLVELHGGNVIAESEGLGKGTTFTVKLPLLNGSTDTQRDDLPHPPQFATVDAQVATHSAINDRPVVSEVASDLAPSCASASTPVEVGSLAGVRIMLVDDEPDNIELLKFILEMEGAIVLPFTSPVEALRTLAQSPPQLLISDIGMPEMNGYEFIQQVRALPIEPGEQVHAEASLLPKAIALTAFAQADDQKRAIEAGYQTYIAKPINPTQLIATIAEVLEMRN